MFHYAGNNPVRYIDPTGAFDWNTNTIEDGDTLSQIAEDCYTKYGVNYTTDNLKDLNKGTISDKNKIYAGTHLNLGKVEEVQRRAADYQSRAEAKYSASQVTPTAPMASNSKASGNCSSVASSINNMISLYEPFVGGLGTGLFFLSGFNNGNLSGFCSSNSDILGKWALAMDIYQYAYEPSMEHSIDLAIDCISMKAPVLALSMQYYSNYQQSVNSMLSYYGYDVSYGWTSYYGWGSHYGW